MKHHLSSVQSAAALVLLAATFGTASAIPTVYVNSATGSNGNSGASPAAAVATVGQGVTLVDEGGTVNVAAGTYVEVVTITKGISLLGPNAGVDPNTGTRVAEAILKATSHNTGNSDWTFNSLIVDVEAPGKTVRIDGLTLEGYNSAVSGGGQTGVGGSPVGATTGIYAANDTVIVNNIIKDVAQFPTYVDGDINIFQFNRVLNSGIPNILGYGTGLIGGTNSYCQCDDNVMLGVRGGFQFQGHNAANAAATATIRNNTITGFESIAIFLNVMSGSAKNWLITGNTLVGQGPDAGTSAVALVSQTDGATKRQHTISDNNVSDIFNGFYFANNTTLRQRISGGTITNVSYAAAFANRLGYNGWITYGGTAGLSGLDGTGGPATFDSAVATAAVNAGLTAQIKVPNGGDTLTGATAFTTDFTGKIALINTSADVGLAAQNAKNAGAVGVIIAATTTAPPIRPTSTTVTSLNIPTTMIDKGDADAIRTALGSGTVTATFSSRLLKTNSFGTSAPAVLTGATVGELINVSIQNATRAGFGVVDIPNSIGPGGVPGTVKGKLLGGSRVSGSPEGAFVFGSKATFETSSAIFDGNGVGARIINGKLVSDGSSFSNNTTAGVLATGSTAGVSIKNSDFFGASQPIDIDLTGTPANYAIRYSNFSADGTAIENRSFASGDVTVNDSYFGSPSGPDDDAGVINGTGARISLGVLVAPALTEPFSPVDTDRDGLYDYQEDVNSNGIADVTETDANNADTDGDTLGDGIEIGAGTNPLNGNDPNNQASPNPAYLTDADGDGLVTAMDPNDNSRDADGDRIQDFYEVLRGSDPANALDFPPFGDANADSQIDNVDAVQIIEAFLGLRDFSSVNRSEIDVNRDGLIDNVDAIILFNFTVANIPYLPFP